MAESLGSIMRFFYRCRGALLRELAKWNKQSVVFGEESLPQHSLHLKRRPVLWLPVFVLQRYISYVSALLARTLHEFKARGATIVSHGVHSVLHAEIASFSLVSVGEDRLFIPSIQHIRHTEGETWEKFDAG